MKHPGAILDATALGNVNLTVLQGVCSSFQILNPWMLVSFSASGLIIVHLSAYCHFYALSHIQHVLPFFISHISASYSPKDVSWLKPHLLVALHVYALLDPSSLATSKNILQLGRKEAQRPSPSSVISRGRESETIPSRWVSDTSSWSAVAIFVSILGNGAFEAQGFGGTSVL